MILGDIYRKLGRSDAEQCFQSCLEIRTKHYGLNNVKTMETLYSIASLRLQQRKYEQAEAHLMQCLQYQEQLPLDSKDPTETLRDLSKVIAIKNSLGNLYNHMKLYPEALAILTPTLEVCRLLYGDNNEVSIQITNNMANSHLHMKNYNDAEPLYIKCRDFHCLKDGPTHPRTLFADNNLGLLKCHQGELDQAQCILLKCYEESRRVFGNNDDVAYLAKQNLAIVYEKKGQYDLSIACLTEYLDWASCVYGFNSDIVYEFKTLLADVYVKMKKLDIAEELYLAALNGRKNLRHMNDIDFVYKTLSRLLTLYRQQRETDKLRSHCIEYLESRRVVDAAGYYVQREVYLVMAILAASYYKEGLYDKAEILFSETVYGLKHFDKIYSERVHDASVSLARTYDKLEKYDGASELFRQIIHDAQKAFGADDPRYVESAMFFGDMLFYNCEKYKEAELVYRDVLMSIKDECTKASDLVLDIYLKLGYCLTYLDKFEEAESFFKIRLERLLSKPSSEENCKAIAKTMKHLTDLYILMGRILEATSMRKERLNLLSQYFEQNHPKILEVLDELELAKTHQAGSSKN